MSEEPTPEKAEVKLPSAFSLFRPSVQALSFNVEAFVFQLAILVGIGLLGPLLFGMSAESRSPGLTVIALIFAILAVAASIIGNASLTLTMLRSAQRQKIGFEKAVRQGLPYVWRLLGVSILTCLIVVAGLILLVVPGLFALQRLILAPYFLIDKNVGVIQALKLSAKAAKAPGANGAMWGLIGVILLIGLVQIIPYIGSTLYLVLWILFLCAPATRYLEITKLAAHDKK